jgi:hypothetical protein
MTDIGYKFFDDGDLADVFKELNEANDKLEQTEEDMEMLASQRRYEEIIKKHRAEGKGNK